MTFTPEQLHESIQKIYPEFEIVYKSDFRQNIANSWANSIDDSPARNDWNWKPKYDISSMTLDMIKNLEDKYRKIQNT
ncbi:hypothetical protein ACKGJN_11600 [Gillisia sp. Q332]|uniref:hypothetical protein n=1 Tax=Gillisia xinjiangensis TaxID=3384765 RepID=UPI003919B658